MNLEQPRLRLFRMKHKFKASPANDRPISLHRDLPLQISVQPPMLGWRAVILFLCANLSLVPFPTSVSCGPYASTWALGPKSSLRLIAAGGPPQGFYRAGIEIRLDPGALTYWRTPGAAGIPPVFSFEGSVNAADITVSYPAPTRIEEDGIDAFGYRDRVTFPLHITPKDAARPVFLAVHLSYAVCARICLPSKADATLTLDPREATANGPEAVTIAAAEAEVPIRLTPQQRDAKVTIDRDKAAIPPTWRLSQNGGAQDLFVEAPPGWYFETRKSSRPDEFLIVAVETPTGDRDAHVPVTLTVKNERQSYEFAIDLDVASLR
ncbi:MAG TPA: protein-disulfide reductase DsbD domain-containing protein [Methylocella sp.]|nr:protein-disulfide reductase DsbD domain-containing protein [Methylocella sp.]